MKKITLILLSIILFNCSNQEEHIKTPIELERESINSQVESDTLYLGFYFGMNREDYRKKLEKLISNNQIKINNDSSITSSMKTDNYKILTTSVSSFFNGKLYRLVNHYYPEKSKKITNINISIDKELLELNDSKYKKRHENGTQNSKYYWLKGNKRIDYYDTLGGYITAFSDMRIENLIREENAFAEKRLEEAKERSLEYAKKYTDISALRFSEDFVKKQLKSPSTAEFISITELMDGVPATKLNDTTFEINSWVDSQNGFGAMIRSRYSCKMTFIPSTDMVQCDNLIIK